MSRLNLDVDAFLARHWQREPLLIRRAIDNFSTPLPADELAGLALEEDIESRLIAENNGDWQLQHGPFQAQDYQRNDPWTLLVQAVDHYVPAVAALRELVDFLPSWRVDDVMVSYANDGGSVGPHYDNYDVFLLQGEGQRLWRLGQPCDATSELLPHPDLRILAQFDCRQEYLLEPGDILYVPPGVAHWGIAQGECTTFSIGFRAPRLQDLLSRWVDHRLDQVSDSVFYSDAQRGAGHRPGELSAVDRQQILSYIQAQMAAADDSWMGELLSEPRYPQNPLSDDEVVALLEQRAATDAPLQLAPEAKLIWQQNRDALWVFANTEKWSGDSALIPNIISLCQHGQWQGDEVDALQARPQGSELLHFLVAEGALYVE
jgi:50S ribosomal protein L16 3-hydroxylase